MRAHFGFLMRSGPLTLGEAYGTFAWRGLWEVAWRVFGT
jgi:hypothetical protein